MGAAVNRAARLQSSTRDVARPVLTSADFAACIDDPVESLGCYLMKGVKEPQQIFAPSGL
jgi:adenylate cyclase